MIDSRNMPPIDGPHKMRDSFRSSANDGTISRETEPRLTPRAAESGGMHCNLLAWVAAQDDLTPHLQGILLRMVRMMAPDGSLMIPQGAIALGIRLGETQTRAAIKALVAADVLLRKRRGSVGKGRESDVLTLNFERQRDNSGASAVSLDNSGGATVSPVSPLPPDNSGQSDNSGPSRLSRDNSGKPPVSNSEAPYKERAGARGTPNLLTTEIDQIRSDQIIPVSKTLIDGLIDRAGSACDPTAPSLHHGADLNRMLRAGCDWEADILPAVDKLAASFRRSGKRFSTWDLLKEHALEFRDRRVVGLPPPAPVPFRAKRTNGYGRQHVNGITPLAYTG